MAEDRARALWAQTKLHVWPERYVLVSFPPSLAHEAAALLGGEAGRFAAVVLERDEAALTIAEETWRESALREWAQSVDGPYCAITLDLDVDLGVFGYLLAAAERLAAAGVSIVPQCGYRKDHVLVRETHLERAIAELEALIDDPR